MTRHFFFSIAHSELLRKVLKLTPPFLGASEEPIYSSALQTGTSTDYFLNHLSVVCSVHDLFVMEYSGVLYYSSSGNQRLLSPVLLCYHQLLWRKEESLLVRGGVWKSYSPLLYLFLGCGKSIFGCNYVACIACLFLWPRQMFQKSEIAAELMLHLQ